jgi:post-segregation antitoxin (ccd killing protein)
MAKVSIYVTEELRSALKRAEIPVSSVCRRALEEEVRKAEALERLRDRAAADAAAERIRGADVDGRVNDGRQCGLAWALERASGADLRAVVDLDSSVWLSLQVTRDGWDTLYEELEALGEYPGEGDFTIPRDDPFIEGFVTGAVEGYWAALAAT